MAGGDGWRKCPQCEMDFVYNKNLSRHVNNVHSKQEWECDKCGSNFKRKDNLHAHIRKGACKGNWR